MIKVKMYSFRNGEAVVGSTWTLDSEGKAVSDSESEYRRFEEDGAIGYGKIYYPKDGEAFLRALPVACSGSYVRAELEEG